MTPGLTKETNTFPLPGFQLFQADLTVFPLFSQPSRKLRDPKTIAHSSIRMAFPNLQTHARSQSIYPKPKRVSEDKPMPESSAHPRRQIYARSRSHMPGSSAHIRSHKQARSRKLSEQQRKYQESMASSTISNSCGWHRYHAECHTVTGFWSWGLDNSI